jgi:hypothetical protein
VFEFAYHRFRLLVSKVFQTAVDVSRTTRALRKIVVPDSFSVELAAFVNAQGNQAEQMPDKSIASSSKQELEPSSGPETYKSRAHEADEMDIAQQRWEELRETHPITDAQSPSWHLLATTESARISANAPLHLHLPEATGSASTSPRDNQERSEVRTECCKSQHLANSMESRANFKISEHVQLGVFRNNQYSMEEFTVTDMRCIKTKWEYQLQGQDGRSHKNGVWVKERLLFSS